MYLAVDIAGEDGATPLHYAARFKPSKPRPSVSRQASAECVENDVSAVVAPQAQALSASGSIIGEVNLVDGLVSTSNTSVKNCS